MRFAYRVMIGLVGAALAAGCASTDSLLGSGAGVTASDPTRLTQSGFLSDYARLKPVSWADGIQCWRDSRLDCGGRPIRLAVRGDDLRLVAECLG